MALILSGDAGITFPVTAGGTSAVQASSGKVLQVVNATYSTQATTTSTSVVTTGFSASITPSSSTSKILVITASSIGTVAASTGIVLQLWRGGSSIFSISPTAGYFSGSTVTQNNQTVTETYLDSPATTSSITYTQYFATFNAGTAYFCINSNPSTITLMEIAA